MIVVWVRIPDVVLTIKNIIMTSRSLEIAAKIAAYREYKRQTSTPLALALQRAERERMGGLVCSQSNPRGSGGASLMCMGHKALHKRSGKDRFDYQRLYAMG